MGLVLEDDLVVFIPNFAKSLLSLQPWPFQYVFFYWFVAVQYELLLPNSGLPDYSKALH